LGMMVETVAEIKAEGRLVEVSAPVVVAEFSRRQEGEGRELPGAVARSNSVDCHCCFVCVDSCCWLS